MDSAAFLARVEVYHKDGWRLALINATTVMPANQRSNLTASRVSTIATSISVGKML